MTHGAPWPRAMNITAAWCPLPVYDMHCSIAKSHEESSTIPHIRVMAGAAPQHLTSIYKGEMQPHSTPCPRPLSSTAHDAPFSVCWCDTALWCPMPHLLAEAPRFESIMEDIDAQEGETPRFAVVVEGKPLPDIMWYKVGWDTSTLS